MIKINFPIKKVFSDSSYIQFEKPLTKINTDVCVDSIELESKCLYNIMGLNGVGKSTILNILSLLTGFNGNYYKQNGTLVINHEKNYAETDLIRFNEFSYIFQDPHIINMYTVKENLEIVNKDFKFTKHMSLIIDKIESSISNTCKNYLIQKIYDLKKNRDNTPYSLSGGEKQLLSFIRAMIKPSRVIFADEPWASMDQNLKDFVEEQLYQYLENKDLFCDFRNHSLDSANTVIMITHMHQHQNNNVYGKLDEEWTMVIPVTNYDIKDNTKYIHSELIIERYKIKNEVII